MAKLERENAALRSMLPKEATGRAEVGVRPENIVWVFGSGRTGSSWLSFMMGTLRDHSRWNEPLVGYLFGNLYYERAWTRQDTDHFILGDAFGEFWLSSLRSLVLEGGVARFPERAEAGYLVIKEPHGAVGAPLLMKALPESRMIFLVRDPRDVAASNLDAHRKGSRPNTRRRMRRPELFVENTQADEESDDILRVQAVARGYLQDILHVKQAYEAHDGHKVLVRYEDLRADALGTLRRIYSTLEIPADEEQLARAVEKHAWENIPEEDKGPGKIRRKATPGGWREDLTPEQAKIVEREAAQVLEQFYAGG